MNTLEVTVRKNKYDYSQIAKVPCANGKTAYCYEQRDEDGNLVGHEVFVPRIQKEDIVTPSNVTIAAGEKFPGDREFGLTAWSVGLDAKRVQEKLEEIIKNNDGR